MSTADPTMSTNGSGPAAPAGLPPVKWVVFIGAAIGTAVVTLWAFLAPTNAQEVLGAVVGWVSTWFGWYYVALATAILVFVIGIAISRYGKIRLGPEHSRPAFSTATWAAMLFAAGIGTDLMFFAVYEPAVQYLTPPSGPGQTVEAAREATVWALFHYGISGWGMYALMGMAMGYFAYRMNLPLAVRSALYPLIGKRVDGAIGHSVDIAAVLGTIFGIATSLGIAVVGLNVGLDLLFGLPQGLAVQAALLVVGVGVATVSAVSGVDRGIKLLSQANVLLAVLLAVYILVTGRTSYLLNAAVLNIGDFVQRFPAMTMQTFAYEDTGDWMSLWTLFFWAWWVAWASFVGLFLARISRGRTIREFVAGCLVIPFSYIVMWITIYGNAAIELIRSGNTQFAETASASPEGGFYALLAEYPAFTFVAGLATLVGLLFYVTSADSGALVMANLSSHLRTVHEDGRAGLRIFWALATGALTLAILSVDGIFALQFATVIMGLPFAFVLVAVMIGLFRALRVEAHRASSLERMLPRLLSGRSIDGTQPSPGSWRRRLTRALAHPSPERGREYLVETALPALREVAAELQQQGVEDAEAELLEQDGITYVELKAPTGDPEHPFRYCIWPQELPLPAYGPAIVGQETYVRLEVHLDEGGQGYDVMGYTHTQLIDDVLDQYERHLEFLRLQHGAPVEAGGPAN
ncbi:choline/glycine/proline betaine transport protein [Pseudonocardia thermophila]|uniref:Choline/glycine/proline betaine transport protein n=1 Tax=Pseudonocardia thermophila TaxID=1848 RepID=A0A1M6Q6Q8_PSETH|nr:choline BCCT transporter BetT [Pseudonocardia thermophila]SHK15922.1 choline/glycine/proline betaine transport protein [Pseudonocardia thermophila]